jgi:hypothetical protein
MTDAVPIGRLERRGSKGAQLDQPIEDVADADPPAGTHVVHRPAPAAIGKDAQSAGGVAHIDEVAHCRQAFGSDRRRAQTRLDLRDLPRERGSTRLTPYIVTGAIADRSVSRFPRASP